MEVAELFVSLAMDADPYNATVDQIVRDSNSWTSGVIDTLGGIGTAFIAVGTVAAGAFAAVGLAAFDVAVDFQSATGSIQAELGITADEAEAVGDIVRGVWGDNFGGTIDEVTEAVIFTEQAMGDLVATAEGIENATEDAFAISDAFDVEVSEAVVAADTLMEEFGLTSDEAFDLIAEGFQQGLNKSDDFLDTINEYSVQFGDAGGSATEFFSLLDTGLAGGMLGTDKAADLFKEFTVRILDGSDATADALDAIGLGADGFIQKIEDGEITVSEAFGEVQSAIFATDDASTQFQNGVALFGTQFEDLGAEATQALDLMGDGFLNSADSVDELQAQYDNWTDLVTGSKRGFLLAIEPIGQVLLDIAMTALPFVQSAFERLAAFAIPLFERLALFARLFIDGFIEGIAFGQGPIDALFSGLINVFDDSPITAFIFRVLEFTQGLQAAVAPLVAFVAGFVEWNDVLIAVGLAVAVVVIPAILAMLAAVLPIILVFAAIIAVVALLRTAWEEDWGGIQQITATAIANVQAFISTALAAIQAFWTEHGATIVATAIAIWEAIKLGIETAITTAKLVISTALAAIQLFWATHGTAITTKAAEVWAAIKLGIETAIANISITVGAVLTGIQTFWAEHGEFITAKASEIWETIKTNIGTIIAAVETAISTALANIQAFWDTHGEAITTIANTVWKAINTIIRTVFEVITTTFGAFRSAMEGDWTAFGEAMRVAWDTAWEAIGTVVENVGAAILTFVAGFIIDMIAKFDAIDWPGVGASVTDGVREGIISGAAGVVQAITDMASAAWDAARGFFGAESPATLFIGLGLDADDGLALGFNRGTEAESAALALAERVASRFAGSSTAGGIQVFSETNITSSEPASRLIRASRAMDNLGVLGIT